MNDTEAREYFKGFQEKYGRSEAALVMLFKDKENYNSDMLFARVALLDRVYSTRLRNDENDDVVHIEKMVNYLYESRERLKEIFSCSNSDPYEAVKAVMGVSYDEKGIKRFNNVYSFATKYCSFMNPDKYPIYDSHVKEAIKKLLPDSKSIEVYANSLDELNKQEGYHNLCKAIIEIKENVFSENSWSTRDIDKILWMSQKHPIRA